MIPKSSVIDFESSIDLHSIHTQLSYMQVLKISWKFKFFLIQNRHILKLYCSIHFLPDIPQGSMFLTRPSLSEYFY